MKLTKEDRNILESYGRTLDGLSDYLGSGYELILHSLESLDHSVIKICNGYHSNRSVGAPITNLALEMLRRIENHTADVSDSFATYFTTNKNGITLKSSTIPIYGTQHKVIGLLCINYYMNTPLSEFISSFANTSPASVQKENFTDNINDVITSAVEEAKQQVLFNPAIAAVNKNREIIHILFDKGIFNIKDAVVKVSGLLGISKNTVYLHLRSLMNSK